MLASFVFSCFVLRVVFFAVVGSGHKLDGLLLRYLCHDTTLIVLLLRYFIVLLLRYT